MSDLNVNPAQTATPAPVAAPAAQPAAPAPAPAPTVQVGDPAPAAAPVVPQAPKEEPKVAPAYESTGDAGLDYALNFVANAGIDDSHPAMQAALKGDFGLLRAELATKGKAGWEQAVALGEQAFKRFEEQAAKDIQVIGSAVTDVAAKVGVDWEETVKWAREHGTDDEIAAVNDLLSKPATAKIAAFYLASNYANSGKVDVPPQRQVAKPDAVAEAGPANSGVPITRVEFAIEAGKLQRKYGDGKYMQSAEYQALARRLIK